MSIDKSSRSTPTWAIDLVARIGAANDPMLRDSLIAELQVRTDLHTLETTHTLQRDLAAQAKAQEQSLRRASWGLFWATIGLVAATIVLIIVTARTA